ncbi:hypothetical protein RPMA_25545 [Tardiphaga alba]|uniref:Uncharacterized protein n=1 Tax=Tardiphaga alba TaxID=340268 RepID=A0ABX8AFY4_9BRAD|nr:hypothetical protein [Tardiphaga alba]QUS41831.1 hypothetical protein RPMA_25545 [Tardiphaga alba]
MSHSIRIFAVALPLAALLGTSALAWELPTLSPSVANAMAQGASPQAIAEYRRKLAEYQEARAAFDADAGAYWNAIAEKRKTRFAKRREGQAVTLNDYVLEQAPLYEGPKRPVNPEPDPDTGPRVRKDLPVVADFLGAARSEFQFAPLRPSSEMEFKRAYARAALQAGISRDIAVRVYSFETGGNGGHDMQSGLNPSKPGSRAISTAIGYNQLLTANTITIIAEKGPQLLKVLNERAAMLQGPQRKAMDHKIAVFKRMHAAVKSGPQSWSAFEKLGLTPQGWAMHALVLDMDVGPQLQVHKLLTSVNFARARGVDRPLSAAELEMMNLTGDGNGFDMVTMPQAMREQVPTANFFQRGGYERNPVAIRHNTVAKLIAITNNRMDINGNLPGAKELAAAFGSATASNEAR